MADAQLSPSSTLSFQLILPFNVNLYGLSAYWERPKYQGEREKQQLS